MHQFCLVLAALELTVSIRWGHATLSAREDSGSTRPSIPVSSTWLCWALVAHGVVCAVLCCLPLCFSAVRFHPLLLPSLYLSTKNKPSSLFVDVLYLDNFPVTMYLLFPNSWVKKPLKLVLAVSVVREQQTPLFPFLLFLSVTCTRSGEVSGSLMNFI